MRAKIIKPFRMAPEGHTVVEYSEGMIVEGRIAEAALEAHAACRMFEPVAEKKIEVVAETKRRRK